MVPSPYFLLVVVLVTVALGGPEQALRWRAALQQEPQCAAPGWAALVQVGAAPKLLRLDSSKGRSQVIVKDNQTLKSRGLLAGNVTVGQHVEAEQLLVHGAVMGQARGMLTLMQHSVLEKAARSEGSNAVGAAFVLPLLVVLVLGIVIYVAMMTLGSRRPATQATSTSAGEVAKARWQRSASGESLRAGSLLPKSAPGPLGSHSLNGRPSAVHRNKRLALPIMCDILISDQHISKLAVPVFSLQDPHFELDVLGGSGAQLLTAAALTHGDRRFIEIRLFAAGTVLAFVTADLQITQANGSLIGSLIRQASAPSLDVNNSHQYVLQDPKGLDIMALFSGQTPQEMKMAALKVDGSLDEYVSRVTRRPAGKLPAEHYEVVVNPGVDAVLILSCWLALTTFVLPPPSFIPVGLYRPTTTLETLPQARSSLTSPL